MVDPTHLVALGGIVGAVLRHLVSEAVEVDAFPAGTLLVNVLGSLVLAVVTVSGASTEATLAIGVGACGSFTTFSSFSYDVVRLWETGRRRVAVGYAAANLLGAVSVVVLVRALAGS